MMVRVEHPLPVCAWHSHHAVPFWQWRWLHMCPVDLALQRPWIE